MAFQSLTYISSFLHQSLLRVEDVLDTAHQFQRTAVVCALERIG